MEKEKELTLNEYQERAMSTCMDTCNNLTYMLTGMNAEVGEINDKIAKAVRKGWISLHRNNITFWNDCPQDFIEGVLAELGDVMWFCAGLSQVLNRRLGDVAQGNLDKLASRKKRGVIDGNGDNR